MAEHANQNIRLRCDECYRALPINLPGHFGGVGYAKGTDDRSVCYACCAKADKAQMLAEGKTTLYLSKNDAGAWVVGNWPSSLVFPARGVRQMRHPWARTAWIAYFTGPDGHEWSAKNIGDNQIAHCRRLARRVAR